MTDITFRHVMNRFMQEFITCLERLHRSNWGLFVALFHFTIHFLMTAVFPIGFLSATVYIASIVLVGGTPRQEPLDRLFALAEQPFNELDISSSSSSEDEFPLDHVSSIPRYMIEHRCQFYRSRIPAGPISELLLPGRRIREETGYIELVLVSYCRSVTTHEHRKDMGVLIFEGNVYTGPAEFLLNAMAPQG